MHIFLEGLQSVLVIYSCTASVQLFCARGQLEIVKQTLLQKCDNMVSSRLVKHKCQDKKGKHLSHWELFCLYGQSRTNMNVGLFGSA